MMQLLMPYNGLKQKTTTFKKFHFPIGVYNFTIVIVVLKQYTMYNYTYQKSKTTLLIALLSLFGFTIKAQTIVADTTKKATTNDTIYQAGQVSFVPFFGTNGTNAAKTVNRFSLNILAGYSMGTKGFEVGGFANINKADMTGFQAAGFTNIVGRNVNGFQSAGFVNVVGGTVRGFQAAGFANVNAKRTEGFQAAGFVNVNGDTTIGGTFAGFANVCKAHTAGLMAAGYVNVAKYKSNGAQIAGFVNYADTLARAAQIAGFINIQNKGVAHTQIAGFINYAKTLNGVQLGFINYADTVTGGTPIGFLSIVRTGVHQIELSFDELLFLNASFRTGTRQFHNIFTAGIGVTGGDNLMWTFGYGAGTTARLSKRLNLDVDLTVNHINKGYFNQSNSQLAKLYLGLEVAATKNFKVALGPTFNVYVADTNNANYGELYSDIAPYSLFSHNYSNGYNIKGWVGGKVALRFF